MFQAVDLQTQYSKFIYYTRFVLYNSVLLEEGRGNETTNDTKHQTEYIHVEHTDQVNPNLFPHVSDRNQVQFSFSPTKPIVHSLASITPLAIFGHITSHSLPPVGLSELQRGQIQWLMVLHRPRAWLQYIRTYRIQHIYGYIVYLAQRLVSAVVSTINTVMARLDDSLYRSSVSEDAMAADPAGETHNSLARNFRTGIKYPDAGYFILRIYYPPDKISGG